MKIKQLKTDYKPFWGTWQGYKTNELRYDDRDFQVGDHLLLRETTYTAHEMALDEYGEAYPLEYTGREILVKVTHSLREDDGIYGLKPGWCVLSIKVLSRLSTVLGGSDARTIEGSLHRVGSGAVDARV